MQTYTIDTITAFISKVKGGYEIISTSPSLDKQFCNDSAVSNKEQFKTIKQCKSHADMLSLNCINR